MVTMARKIGGARRPRLYVDVSEGVAARVKQVADHFYRGATSDAVLAAIAAFTWMLDQKRQGRRVIAVEEDALPQRFNEVTLPGVDEVLGSDRWSWLIERPHPWRRQLWVKGRRIRAAEVAGDIAANAWTPEEAARQFDLPLDAVLEAQRYVAANGELIGAETVEERRILLNAATLHPPEAVGAHPR